MTFSYPLPISQEHQLNALNRDVTKLSMRNKYVFYGLNIRHGNFKAIPKKNKYSRLLCKNFFFQIRLVFSTWCDKRI